MHRLALSLALLAAPVAVVHAQTPTPVASYSPGSAAFIDDAFALRDDGKSIVFVTTDGAAPATLHIAEVGGAQRETPGLPPSTAALYWLGPERVLAVSRDARLTGVVYNTKGASKEKLGPAEAVVLATVAGKPAVVAFARTEKRVVDYALTAYDRDTWKVLAKKALHGDGAGRIAHPAGPFKPLWWSTGYVELATLKAGEFDKARDMRRPDRFARLDVFGNKLRDEQEIEDVLEFARVSRLHAGHDGEEAFVHLSEDHHKLLLTDGLVENEITLPRGLHLYEPDSIAYQVLDADRVAVSLTIDPVNPEALKRQKADPDDLDIYLVDRHTRAATLALRLSGQGRPSAWRIAGGRIAVLRKSKGFNRGGVALEVYDFANAPAAGRE
jgi:hypothetical protein